MYDFWALPFSMGLNSWWLSCLFRSATGVQFEGSNDLVRLHSCGECHLLLRGLTWHSRAERDQEKKHQVAIGSPEGLESSARRSLPLSSLWIRNHQRERETFRDLKQIHRVTAARMQQCKTQSGWQTGKLSINKSENTQKHLGMTIKWDNIIINVC